MKNNEQPILRLTFQNVTQFYPNLGKNTRLIFEPRMGMGLSQADFGKSKDCALTSMAAIFGPEYYNVIEQQAMQYGYDGEIRGTKVVAIRKIMQNVMNHIGGEYSFKKAKSAYLKNIGFKWDTCKSLSDRKIPYILSLSNDGRNLYKNHSVEVVGYMEFENGRFLIVYDNWASNTSLIDYNKMSIFSSINWME